MRRWRSASGSAACNDAWRRSKTCSWQRRRHEQRMSDARIIDQGYRPYTGPRRGRAGAIRSLAWHSVLRALGLRRTAWAKVLPIAAVVIAYLPAAVFVGVAVLIPRRVRDEANVLPTYHGYYGFITAAIV